MMRTFQDLFNFTQKVKTGSAIPMSDNDIAELRKAGNDRPEYKFWDKVRNGYHLAVWRYNRKRTCVLLSNGNQSAHITFRPDGAEVQDLDDYQSYKNMPVYRFSYADNLTRAVNKSPVVRKELFAVLKRMNDKEFLKWSKAEDERYAKLLSKREVKSE